MEWPADLSQMLHAAENILDAAHVELRAQRSCEDSHTTGISGNVGGIRLDDIMVDPCDAQDQVDEAASTRAGTGCGTAPGTPKRCRPDADSWTIDRSPQRLKSPCSTPGRPTVHTTFNPLSPLLSPMRSRTPNRCVEVACPPHRPSHLPFAAAATAHQVARAGTGPLERPLRAALRPSGRAG